MKSASNTINHTQHTKSKMFEHNMTKNNNSKRQDNNTQNIKYEVRETTPRRPIPFLDDFEKK